MIFPLRDDNPARRTPLVTYAIVAVNVAVLLWMNRLDDGRQQLVALEYGFVPARIAQLQNGRPLLIHMDQMGRIPQLPRPVVVRKSYILTADRPEIVRSLVTTMFLHGSWVHLLSNMWFLWIFGNNVEDRLGHAAFALFYLVGGLGATACHWWSNPGSTVPVVGASGAVAAILGAYAVTFPAARITCLIFIIIYFTIVHLPALLVLGGWFLLQFIYARQQPGPGVMGGVAYWAHMGGFVAGALMMNVVNFISPPEEPQSSSPEWF